MYKYFNTEDLTSLKKIMKLYTRLHQAANNNYQAEKALEIKTRPLREKFLESFTQVFKERIRAMATEEQKAEIDKKVEELQFYLDHPERVEEWPGFDPYTFAECENELWNTAPDPYLLEEYEEELASATVSTPYEYYVNTEIKPRLAYVRCPQISIINGSGTYGGKEYSLFDLLTEAEKSEYYETIEQIRKECAQKEKEIAEKRAEAQEILQNFNLMEVVRRNTFINNVEFLRFEGKNTKIYLICDHEGHKKEIEFFPSNQERDRDNTERLLELLAVQKEPWSLKDC